MLVPNCPTDASWAFLCMIFNNYCMYYCYKNITFVIHLVHTDIVLITIVTFKGKVLG